MCTLDPVMLVRAIEYERRFISLRLTRSCQHSFTVSLWMSVSLPQYLRCSSSQDLARSAPAATAAHVLPLVSQRLLGEADAASENPASCQESVLFLFSSALLALECLSCASRSCLQGHRLPRQVYTRTLLKSESGREAGRQAREIASRFRFFHSITKAGRLLLLLAPSPLTVLPSLWGRETMH